MREIGLYLHFPFCVRKCLYCDFLSAPSTEEVKKIYAAALIREIRGYREAAADCVVTSVFLGGGTPSIMPVMNMREVFRALYDSFRIAEDAEITMEVNPGTVNETNLSLIFDYVNRVSVGVESASDEELARLGRIHSFADAVRSIGLLRQSGVKNLNVDLMSGIPGQTAASWEKTLKEVTALQPEHISAYSLIVEDGTPFRDMQKAGKLSLPDEETERRMYALTRELLHDAGYRQYEFSNYAKPGYACRHNLRYWKRGEYLGLGLGASSLFGGSRWKNTEHLEKYFEDSADPGKLIREMEQLDKRAEIEEYMFLGLRMTDGISEEEFLSTFGVPVSDIYGEVIKRHIEDGTLEAAPCGRYRLTPRGIDVSNVVLADFLFE